MFDRILVPLDGSTDAEHVLPVAARIARASHGSIILLRAVRVPVRLGRDVTTIVTAPPREHGSRA
jgi:nucleotide-binding universal stress UspA family protein